MEYTTMLWVRALFGTLYILWGASWTLVAWNYGRAAYVSWTASRGQWTRALAEISSPFVWGAHVFWRRLLGKPHDPYPERYAPGHLLRFGVFLGALAPSFWGFYFVALDRENWDGWDRAVNMSGVIISILAAMCHLWLAYRSTPVLWARNVALTVGWLILAPPFFVWLWS